MKYNGIESELRVITNSTVNSSIHDRWIVSKNSCFNVPSPDVVYRGQYSEVKNTDSKPPFENWWETALDIVSNWNQVKKAMDEFQNKKKPT